jgi:hypothetical protein
MLRRTWAEHQNCAARMSREHELNIRTVQPAAHESVSWTSELCNTQLTRAWAEHQNCATRSSRERVHAEHQNCAARSSREHELNIRTVQHAAHESGCMLNIRTVQHAAQKSVSWISELCSTQLRKGIYSKNCVHYKCWWTLMNKIASFCSALAYPNYL